MGEEGEDERGVINGQQRDPQLNSGVFSYACFGK